MLHQTGYRLEELLVGDLARQAVARLPIPPGLAGRQIAQSSPNSRRVLRWRSFSAGSSGVARAMTSNSWKMRQALFLLFKRKLPLSEGDILVILDGRPMCERVLVRGTAADHQAGQRPPEGHGPEPGNEGQAASPGEGAGGRADERRSATSGAAAEGTHGARKSACRWIRAISGRIRRSWRSAPGSRRAECLGGAVIAVPACDRLGPRQEMDEGGPGLLARTGEDEFRAAVLRWFELADRPRPVGGHRELGEIPLPGNADVLKGLAWTCSRFDSAEVGAGAVRVLVFSAYRRLRGQGPVCSQDRKRLFLVARQHAVREGLAQLSILKARIKGTGPQKAIAGAIDLAETNRHVRRRPGRVERANLWAGLAWQPRHTRSGYLVTRIQVAGSAVEQVWERGG